MTNILRTLFVVACLLPSLGQTASVTLTPTADAFVQAGANANINFGNVTRLRSQTVDGTTINDYESYLKFDTVTTTGQITSAKLRLYSATSGVGSVAVTAHGVADTNWNESTITWNNKPARGTAFGTAMVSGTSYIWREIDVTDHILQERNAGRSLVSLGLANTASSSVYAHASSRNAEFNWPQLVIVTAPANAPPTVSLTAPANGSSYTAPATVNLSANASDSDGSITKVEFYNGASLIGTDTSAPYTFTWSNVATGSHSLTAKATDNAGAVTTSAAVSISVTSPPPPPPSVSLYYLYADHLNTPRVVTDSSNKVVWRWDSDAFGTSTANEDPDGDGVGFTYNPRFPGQYYDKETGLHYNYFRDYEPSTGWYGQADPIGLDGGLNLYSYANQNPIIFTDPDGLTPGTAVGAGIGTLVFPGPGTAIGALIGTGIQALVGGATIAAIMSTPGDASISESRSIPAPAKPKCGCTCNCRADANLNDPKNTRAYAFGTATESDCATASKVAKRNATRALGQQPKHVGCRCSGS